MANHYDSISRSDGNDVRIVNNNNRIIISSSKKNKSKKWLSRILLLGQGVALVAASMGASSYTLSYRFGIQTQFFQMLFLYLLLSLHLLLLPFRRQSQSLPSSSISETSDAAASAASASPPQDASAEDECLLNEYNCDENTPNDSSIIITSSTATTARKWFSSLRNSFWFYLCISFLDVFSNLLLLLSFQYTSLTSTTLLGLITVPSTMLFSRYIMTKHFGWHHYLGVLFCLAGGVLTIWSDASFASSNGNNVEAANLQQQQHPNRYLGDCLACIVAILYGLSDTIAEYSVKYMDREEYLGMIGMFGTLFTICLLPFWGLSQVQEDLELLFQPKVATVMVWYLLSVLLYYISATYFLQMSDATLLTLSTQTTNLWAIVFSVVAYHELPAAAFYLAVVLVANGAFIYELPGARECCCQYEHEGIVTAFGSDEPVVNQEFDIQNSKDRDYGIVRAGKNRLIDKS